MTEALRAVLQIDTSLMRPSNGAFSRRSLPISSGLVLTVISVGMPYDTANSSFANRDCVYSAVPLRYTVTVCPLLTSVTCVQRFGSSTSCVSNQMPRVPVSSESSWYWSVPLRKARAYDWRFSRIICSPESVAGRTQACRVNALPSASAALSVIVTLSLGGIGSSGSAGGVGRVNSRERSSRTVVGAAAAWSANPSARDRNPTMRPKMSSAERRVGVLQSAGAPHREFGFWVTSVTTSHNRSVGRSFLPGC